MTPTDETDGDGPSGETPAGRGRTGDGKAGGPCDGLPSRRRLLRATGAVGAVGLTGCLAFSPFRDEDYEDYLCTDIDDEPTDRYDTDLLPFTFEKPEAMTLENTTDRDRVTMIELAKEWFRDDEQGNATVNAIRLTLSIGPVNNESRSEFWAGKRVTTVGSVDYGGKTNDVVRRRPTEDGDAVLVVLLPGEDGSDVNFRRLEIAVEALLATESQERAERQSDADQSCSDAVENVALAAATSLEPR